MHKMISILKKEKKLKTQESKRKQPPPPLTQDQRLTQKTNFTITTSQTD